MKNIYFSPAVLKSLCLLGLMMLTVGFATSCKDREEDPNQSVAVHFNVRGTKLEQIKAVVTQIGTQQSINYNVTSSNYQTTPQVVNTSIGAVHVGATAIGEDADALLIVDIFVNGEKKATDTAKGIDLTAKTMYNLLPY